VAAWTGAEDDARLERRLRAIVPPVVLGLAYLVQLAPAGRGFFRVFAAMWIHELGHAVSAWLSGFAAFPGPWRTSIGDARSAGVGLLVSALLVGGGIWSWRKDRRLLVPVACGVLLVVQLVCTLGLARHQAQAFISFAGDGGQLVLGTLLMLTFWAPPGSKLHRDWLRWGFLVIGALAFMDAFTTWQAAARDHDAIPFGEIEGVGASDPSVLVDQHGWTIARLIRRHQLVGWLCLAGLAARYAWALWRSRRPMLRS
jgi:hypothetical protein